MFESNMPQTAALSRWMRQRCYLYTPTFLDAHIKYQLDEEGMG